MENFDWEGFFRERNGGHFIEMLRGQWRREFDIVLIDSRTGLSDTGGICTIQLPDIVVAMFTANYQSVYGVRDVMRLAQHARQTLAIDRMPLTVLPLPARFGTRAEFKESQEWLHRFEEALHEFYEDWLPSSVQPRYVLERLKVPQIDYFSFGEKLAVLEQGVSDPEGMGYVYDKVAAVLANDFSDIEPVVGQEVAAQASNEGRRRKSEAAPTGRKEDYKYDIFVSHAPSQLTSEWVREMLQMLSMWVEQLIGRHLEVFFDIQELQLAESFVEPHEQALKHSKLLLVIAEPRYFSNEYAIVERQTFEIRSQISKTNLIIPVTIQAAEYENLPNWLREYQYVDLSEFFVPDMGDEFRQSIKYVELQNRVKVLAQAIKEALERVPAFEQIDQKETEIYQFLGIRLNVPAGSLAVMPDVPDSRSRLSVQDLKVGGGTMAASASRTNNQYTTEVSTTSPWKLTIGHTIPAGASLQSVTLDGLPARYNTEKTTRGCEVRVETDTNQYRTLVVTTI